MGAVLRQVEANRGVPRWEFTNSLDIQGSADDSQHKDNISLNYIQFRK